jgi:hypothetical protein
MDYNGDDGVALTDGLLLERYDCACSKALFLLISTFGGLGIVISNLLSTYQVPLRLVSIGILLFALYSVDKRVTESCVVEYKNKKI